MPDRHRPLTCVAVQMRRLKLFESISHRCYPRCFLLPVSPRWAGSVKRSGLAEKKPVPLYFGARVYRIVSDWQLPHGGSSEAMNLTSIKL